MNPTENQFITVSYDKFKQITTTTSNLNTSLGYTLQLLSWTSGYILQVKLRHVKSPEIEGLVLDLRLDSGDGWVFLRSGELQLVLDMENLNIKPVEKLSSTDSEIKSGTSTREEVYYDLSQEILDKICSANDVAIRLTGKQIYFDLNEEQISAFKTMCQQFYNNFYDNTKYTSSITQSIKSKGACFIATATMGSYDHPVVIDLREFRDNWLLKRKWGVLFTDWYYLNGAKAAKIIDKSFLLKKIAFVTLIKPLHLIIKRLTK